MNKIQTACSTSYVNHQPLLGKQQHDRKLMLTHIIVRGTIMKIKRGHVKASFQMP